MSLAKMVCNNNTNNKNKKNNNNNYLKHFHVHINLPTANHHFMAAVLRSGDVNSCTFLFFSR